ncbi:hypothetical protein IU459_01365 [Nocardia amamiensis]|uniref:Uncharacterized protein n=1 Tax=Nocardia amamiensis TaxID=404578 RepID=A0ABS0CMV6_9NOCA|nr:hypothetical protein [Nocardia amamiensis]MBF6296189.1 hypothetical protein [Nocardia amamiensis]
MFETGIPQPRPHDRPSAPRPGQQPVRTWDLVLAIVLYCAAAILGLTAAYFTLFFAFATDPCTPTTCRTEYLAWAFAVSWGGTGLALAGTFATLIVAVIKRWYLWFWPVLAMLLIIGSFCGGAALAAQVYTGP